MKLVFNPTTGYLDYVASTATDVGLTGLATSITATKTLTLVATDTYSLTIPATGTAALLQAVNMFTAQNDITATMSTPTVAAVGLNLNFTHAAGAVGISTGQRGQVITYTITGSAGSSSGPAGLLVNVLNENTGTINNLYGASILSRSSSASGDITAAVAVRGTVGTTGAGTISTGTAIQAVTPTKTSTGAITTVVGLHAQNQGLSGTTTSYGLLIDNQSGSTTNYGIYVGTCTGNYLAGNTGIGILPTTTDLLYVNKSITTTTGTLSGVQINPIFSPSGASSSTNYGVRCIAQSGGAQTMTNLYGADFKVLHNTTNTMGLLVGGNFHIQNNNASTVTTANDNNLFFTSVNASSVITTGNYIKINSPTMTAGSIVTLNGILIQNLGAVGVTNAYGIKIEAISGAATLNYAIYTDAGTVYFGGTLQTNGGRIGKVTTVTDTYTVLVTDETIVCNKATDFTVTMPTAVVGQVFVIKNINTGHVTITAPGTDTFDEVDDDLILDQYDCIKLQCRLANKWIKIT